MKEFEGLDVVFNVLEVAAGQTNNVVGVTAHDFNHPFAVGVLKRRIDNGEDAAGHHGGHRNGTTTDELTIKETSTTCGENVLKKTVATTNSGSHIERFVHLRSFHDVVSDIVL